MTKAYQCSRSFSLVENRPEIVRITQTEFVEIAEDTEIDPGLEKTAKDGIDRKEFNFST